MILKQTPALLVSIILIISAQSAFSQGMAINNTGSPADPSAALDVSTTTKGVLIPRMTTSQKNAIPTPATGLLVYQTDSVSGFYYFTGAAWNSIAGSGGSGSFNDTLFTNLYTNGYLISGDGGTGIRMGDDGQIVDSGTVGSGSDLAISGAGTRMIWYPKQSAFRAGTTMSSEWDAANIGPYSVAFGQYNTASGNASTALGVGVTASGYNALAIGRNISATGFGAMVIGDLAAASGQRSTAIGSGIIGLDSTIASGDNSIAIGNGVRASGNTSNAFGYRSTASGDLSTAMGSFVSTNGNSGSFIIGDNVPTGFTGITSNTAPGQMMMRFGGGYVLAGGAGVAINGSASSADPSAILDLSSTSQGVLAPRMTQAQEGGIPSPATGLLVYQTDGIPGYYSYNGTSWIAVGAGTFNDTLTQNLYTNGHLVSGDGGTGILMKDNGLFIDSATFGAGSDLTTVGAGTRIMWYPKASAFRVGTVTGTNWDVDSIAPYSIAMGQDSKATGWYGTAIGQGSAAIGTASSALGPLTTATGNNASAFGFWTTAAGNTSTAMGYRANALGDYSFAIGEGATAIGSDAVAIGNRAFAAGSASTALGNGNNAIGDNSLAMGIGDSASGNGSVAMGEGNSARGDYSTAFGRGTLATGNTSIAMGNAATAGGISSTAIGTLSSASGDYSTAMGFQTTAGGTNSTAMGYQAVAGGDYSTATGFQTTASGYASTSMGSYVSTNDSSGSFIIGDNTSTLTTLNSSAANQMMMRFNGGYVLYADDGTTTGVQLASGGGAWSSVSDRRKKEHFTAPGKEDVLMKLCSLPVTEWNYKTQPQSRKHMGPMAQDFYAAFHLDGIGNDTTINSVDIDGVNMIAIQALEKRTADLKAENDKLKAENEQLKTLVNGFADRINKVEAMVSKQDQSGKLSEK